MKIDKPYILFTIVLLQVYSLLHAVMLKIRGYETIKINDMIVSSILILVLLAVGFVGFSLLKKAIRGLQ